MNIIEGRYTNSTSNFVSKESDMDANLIIGSFCCIGDNVTVFLGSEHRTEWFSTFQFGHYFYDFTTRKTDSIKSNGDIVIGNDVWIGYGVTIMSGVTIGDGACIAANSHIVKNVEPYSVVGGDPATFIKYRFSPEIIEYLLRLQWWNLSIELINELSPFLCSDDFKALQNKVIELKIL